MLAYVPLILISVSLNAMAQIMLKQGMLTIGRFEFVAALLPAILRRAALSPFIIGGMACYAVSIVLWLVVLSRVDVSAAYPFNSIGFVIAAMVGHWYFAEALSSARMWGIALICAGVVLISRT